MSPAIQQITVKVKPVYLAEKSNPKDSTYAFSYDIKIINNGTAPVKILARRWYIADANDKVQEVYGEGVVGEQPLINPGAFFEYSSSVVINTPVGNMRGVYYAKDTQGNQFDIAIPAFTLAVPNALH